MNLGSLFLSPDGRLGRRDFWISVLILMGASLIASRLPVLDRVIGLAVTYCGVCIGSKRLHDLGHSGLLLMLPILIWVGCFSLGFLVFGGSTFVAALRGNGVLPAMAGSLLIFAILMLIAFAAVAIFSLWAGLKTGDPAANKYGPVPASLFGADRTQSPAAAPADKPDTDGKSPPEA